MTVSLCKHSFPCQPPRGTLAHPGDCVHCDATWDAVQADLRLQQAALIAGTAHDGTCERCNQPRRLYRFQPQDKPWNPIEYVEPVTFLCIADWNRAAEDDIDDYEALLDAI